MRCFTNYGANTITQDMSLSFGETRTYTKTKCPPRSEWGGHFFMSKHLFSLMTLPDRVPTFLVGMTSKIEAAGEDLRKGEFISPEHYNHRGPQRIVMRWGTSPPTKS